MNFFAQTVSGSVSYALGCGKSIISTKTLYAEEILSDDKGILVPFRDSSAIAKGRFCLMLEPIVEIT